MSGIWDTNFKFEILFHFLWNIYFLFHQSFFLAVQTVSETAPFLPLSLQHLFTFFILNSHSNQPTYRMSPGKIVHSDFSTPAHDNDPFNKEWHCTAFAILAMFDQDDITSNHKPTSTYIFVGTLLDNCLRGVTFTNQKMSSGILCDPVLLDEKWN